MCQNVALCGNGLTLSQTKSLDSSKLKEFADNNSKFDGNDSEFSKRLENTGGKREIARYERLFEKRHPKNIPVKLFQNLISGSREDF